MYFSSLHSLSPCWVIVGFAIHAKLKAYFLIKDNAIFSVHKGEGNGEGEEQFL